MKKSEWRARVRAQNELNLTAFGNTLDAIYWIVNSAYNEWDKGRFTIEDARAFVEKAGDLMSEAKRAVKS
jgi:hypothetical protein